MIEGLGQAQEQFDNAEPGGYHCCECVRCAMGDHDYSVCPGCRSSLKAERRADEEDDWDFGGEC